MIGESKARLCPPVKITQPAVSQISLAPCMLRSPLIRDIVHPCHGDAQ